MATSSQTKVGWRYAGTSAATAFTIMGALSIVSPDQAQQLIAALHQLNDSIVSGYGAVIKMWVILGPVAGVWLARVGINSSTVQGLIQSLLSKAATNTPEGTAAKAAIANAAVDLPGSQKLVNPELAAIPATSPKVTVQ